MPASENLLLTGKSTVDGKGAGALDHDGQGNGERQKVVLNAFALLGAGPVYKKPEMAVDHRDGHHHVASDAESGDAAEESEEQADAAEEFGADGQESEWRGDVHDLREEAHGAGESVAAKPAESFLRTVREKDHAKDEAKHSKGFTLSGVNEFAEHEHASLFLEEKWDSM
jgi:hypothetical protein